MPDHKLWKVDSPVPPLAFPLSGPESEKGGRGFHHSRANKKSFRPRNLPILKADDDDDESVYCFSIPYQFTGSLRNRTSYLIKRVQ